MGLLNNATGKLVKYLLPTNPKMDHKTSLYAELQSYNGYSTNNSIILQTIYKKIANDFGRITFICEDEELSKKLNYRPNIFEKSNTFWQNVCYMVLTKGSAIFILDNNNNFILLKEVTGDNLEYSDNGKKIKIEADKKYILDYDRVFVIEFSIDTMNQIRTLVNKYNKLVDKMITGNSSLLHISTSTNLDDAKIATLRKSLVKDLFDNNDGILFTDSKIKEAKVLDKASSYDKKLIDDIKTEIYASFGLNEAVFNGNYTEGQYKAYLQNVIYPLTDQLHQELTYKLGKLVKIVVDDFTFLPATEQAKYLKDLRYASIHTLNELRSKINLDPVEDGDAVIENKNYITSEDLKGGD